MLPPVFSNLQPFRGRWILLLCGFVEILACCCPVAVAQPSLYPAVRQGQVRVVKIYGFGGVAGLEGYQSGFIVSPEGHVATVWSYVLDAEPTVVLDDGRRFQASIVGFEPQLELAVLKIDATDLPFFKLREELSPQLGDPVLAISNLYGIATGSEPASVMRGSVSGTTRLNARRGTFKTAYSGNVYIVDLVANNPGAAGGALVDTEARLIGMLGKELRDISTGAWLNYAIPTTALKTAIGDIVAGRRQMGRRNQTASIPTDRIQSLAGLGIVMIPNVLDQTPAYIDAVSPNSLAGVAGLKTNDLILLMQNQRIDSQTALAELLQQIDNRDTLSVTVQRGAEIIVLKLDPK